MYIIGMRKYLDFKSLDIKTVREELHTGVTEVRETARRVGAAAESQVTLNIALTAVAVAALLVAALLVHEVADRG